jgi:hypothetical protein
MVRTLVLWLATLGLVTPALGASCAVARFGFLANQVSQATMVAPSGRTCRIVLNAGGRSRFDSARIVSRPRNGTATASTIAVTYQSKPGYKGTDSFSFSVNGRLAPEGGAATIQVTVQVN